MKTAADLNIEWKWTDPPPIHLFGFRRALVRAWRDKFGRTCSCGKEMLFGLVFHPLPDYASVDHIHSLAPPTLTAAHIKFLFHHETPTSFMPSRNN